MNERHLFPIYDHEIHLSPSLECLWLSIMLILSLFSTFPNHLLLLFDFLDHLIQNFYVVCLLSVCLLACLLFLTGTDTEFPGVALACFPILFSLLFLLYCFSAFPFVCVSLFFLFSSILSASFSPLCIFSPLVIPSSSPKITDLFLLFLSTFHSLDYSFQRLMNLACS